MTIELKLEIRETVIATKTITSNCNDINKATAYWWNLYGLKNKNFRIYYDRVGESKRA